MSAIAVVIPAYNERAAIRGVVEGALQHARRVIVVDDGSSDGTAELLEGLPATVVRNARNLGKAASLGIGMAIALGEGADAVVTLDADGQHRPGDIPLLLAAWRRNPEALVTGARLHEGANIPAQRYLANRFANFWIAWAAGQPLEDSQCGFRVYPASLLRGLPLPREGAPGFVFESEVLIEAGRRGVPIVSIPIPAIYGRPARASHFRPVQDIARIVRMVAWKILSRGMDLPGLANSLGWGASPTPGAERTRSEPRQ
jgi:glycosyltransferase involved in cell wall biosynthesis